LAAFRQTLGFRLMQLARLKLPQAKDCKWHSGQHLGAGGGGGGSGTVTYRFRCLANGLSGTVANATTTPAITLGTSITGMLKGNGSAYQRCHG